MYKLLVPLLRCEVPDMRDSVINGLYFLVYNFFCIFISAVCLQFLLIFLITALGRINHNAIMDLMSELVNYIREAIDRKQENMRRRRRRY